MSYPYELVVNGARCSGEDAEVAWEQILSDIVFAFEFVLKVRLRAGTYRSDRELLALSSISNASVARATRGLKLFSEHYVDLWD